MIYNILCDGISIYDANPQSGLLNPKLELELNEPGTLTFDMLPTHSYYNIITPFVSNIEVLENGETIFFGRVLDVTITFSKVKKITCEGALGYLYDTVQMPASFIPSDDSSTEQTTIHDFFAYLLTEHNKYVTSTDRQILPGTCNLTNKSISRELNYDKTMDCIKKMCVDSFGGYLFVRKEDDEIYLDWLRDLSGISNQPIQYAVNLTDYTNDFKGSDMVTSIVPVGEGDLDVSGKDEHDEWYNKRNPGRPYIDSDAVETYGRIIEQVDFDGITDPETLYEYGLKWLTDKQFDVSSIQVNAADLKYFNPNYENYALGQSVHITSNPHLIDTSLPIMKISYALDSPLKAITIGTPERKSLTSMYGSGSGGSSGGGGGTNKSQVKRISTQVVEQEVPKLVQYNEILEGGVKTGSIMVGDSIVDIYTNTMYGIEEPTSSMGADGSIYIQRIPKYQTVEYVRTNYSQFGLILSNWQYDLTDKFELTYRNNANPEALNQWPHIIGAYGTSSTPLFIQFNLFSTRTCMNITYNGNYTGDNAISFSSPFDYTNYYTINADGGSFSIKKGPDLDHITTTAATWTKETGSGQIDGSVKLYCATGGGAMDTSLYGIKVWNSSDELIHNYIPIKDGVLDTVDMTTYVTTTTGHINGPLFDNNYAGHISAIWYKRGNVWCKSSLMTDGEIPELITLTEAEYNDLSDAQKMDLSKAYFVTDAVPTNNYVIPNPPYEPTRELNTIEINGLVYDIPGDVEANPEDEATESLTKLKIEDTTYSISGSDVGAMGFALPTLYSNDERVVGKWIDGTPIYQKTIYYAGGVSGVFTINHNIDNLKKVIDYFGTVKDVSGSSSAEMPLPRIAVDNNNVGIQSINNTYISLCNPTAFSQRLTDWYVTIQYTKTTDLPVGKFDLTMCGIFAPEIYTDTEREIGVWVNNKPLYQKTIVGTTTISGQTPSISLGIENVEDIYLVDASTSRSTSSATMRFNIPYVHYDVKNVVGGFFIVDPSDTVFNLRVGSQIAGIVTNLILTVRYTKTTDVAGSGSYTNLGVPAEHYSTDEQIIGTYFGKTLYRKGFTFSSLTFSSQSISITNDLSNLHEITNYGGSFHDPNDNRSMPLPYERKLYNEHILLQCVVLSDTHTASIQLLTNVNNYTTIENVNVWVEYTKTTD